MADHAAKNAGFVQLNDAQYDTIRRFIQIVIPGLASFYAALALLWHWGFIAEVTGTATALVTLGGVILKFARDGYEPPKEVVPVSDLPPDGQVVADTTADGKPILRVQLDPNAKEDLLNKPLIVIKGFDPEA